MRFTQRAKKNTSEVAVKEKSNGLRIALVHDGIFCRAGGERVLLNMHKAFPSAPIYTGIYVPDATFPEFKSCDIRVSAFNRIAKTEQEFKKRFFPFGPIAMSRLDLRSYDLVIMTTTHSAKYVRVGVKTLVIAYCFTPFRLAWDPHSYRSFEDSSGLKRWVWRAVVGLLKWYDFRKAQRVDRFIGMTKETSERVVAAYSHPYPIPIVRPTIDVNKYQLSVRDEGYYLVVSRLEKYKRVDLVIDAFNQLGRKLIVVGKGSEKESLLKQARGDVTFLENLSDSELAQVYQNCRAFIFPQHEDYGLTPLEANACGKPVIAYGKGGVLETQIPYSEKDEEKWTSVFFDKQDSGSLLKAMAVFEALHPNSDFIRRHAEEFDDSLFVNRIKKTIAEVTKTSGIEGRGVASIPAVD